MPTLSSKTKHLNIERSNAVDASIALQGIGASSDTLTLYGLNVATHVPAYAHRLMRNLSCAKLLDRFDIQFIFSFALVSRADEIHGMTEPMLTSVIRCLSMFVNHFLNNSASTQKFGFHPNRYFLTDFTEALVRAG